MDEPLLIPATTAVLMYHYVRPDDAPMRVGAEPGGPGHVRGAAR